jgi:hypothetical protein
MGFEEFLSGYFLILPKFPHQMPTVHFSDKEAMREKAYEET